MSSSLGLAPFTNDSSFIDSLWCSDDHYNISCVEACGDVQGIFHNWPNFYTCSWYPSISTALGESTKSGQWVDSADSLGKKGIYGDQQALSINISFAVANCLTDYCQWSSDCRSLDFLHSCSLERLMPSNGSAQTLNHANAVTCLKDGVCSSTSDVNPDIGGLGVRHTIPM